MAVATSGATLVTSSWLTSGGSIGTVSPTMRRAIGSLRSTSRAWPTRSAWVTATGDRLNSTGRAKRVNGGGDCSPRAQHVVDDERGAVPDIADDAVRRDVLATESRLVDESHRRLQQAGVLARASHGAEIGRDHDRALAHRRRGSARQQGHGAQVVERHVEEPLGRSAMRIDQHQSIEPCGRDDVGHHARAERSAIGPAVLPRVAEVRDDRCQPAGSRTAAGVGEEEELHHVLLDGGARRLQQIDVTPANRTLNLDLHLSIGKAPTLVHGGRHLEHFAHFAAETHARGAGKYNHPVVHLCLLFPTAISRMQSPGHLPFLGGPIASPDLWQLGVCVMRFKNREEAATELAGRLADYRGQHPLVLGVPRGAVPMARIIADSLGGDLDVVLVRKLRAPGQPELAIGAVDEAGSVLKGWYFELASDEYVREEVRTQQEILRKRRVLYTRAKKAVDPAGRVVIIVDDGIATGSSMLSAIRSVRARRPGRDRRRDRRRTAGVPRADASRG